MGRERETEEQKVERLTTMAESGDKGGLMQELHAMDPYERSRIAHQMDDLNAQHREVNSKLPDIQIVTNTDTAGAERLQDIITQVPNDAKAWYKPWTWFDSSEITTDVYDPQHDELGSGWMQQAMEGVGGRKQELDRILAEMNK